MTPRVEQLSPPDPPTCGSPCLPVLEPVEGKQLKNMTGKHRHLFLLFCLSLICLLAGCSESSREVDETVVTAGAEQSALAGEKFATPLRVELRGENAPGLLGGEGSVLPVPGVTVLFVPADGSDLRFEPASAVSDAGGVVSTIVTAGNNFGDQFARIIPVGFEDKATTVRFVSGMQIRGQNNEYASGSLAAKPLEVTLIRDGKPLAGVPVRFDLRATAEGVQPTAKILSPRTVTNNHGVASTGILLGEKTGAYNVGITIDDRDQDFAINDITVRVMAFNRAAIIIAVIGGLALFVLGMKLMSDGLGIAAGENMRKILQFLTRNRVVALLAGTIVTAVLQASSATTVMVIGFINAGLLTLTQSIGIIFGANIGTTVTAQIISFDLSGVALPAIAFGLFISLFKRRQLHGWGTAIMGFGLLFLGLDMMSSELKVLGEMHSFRAFFNLFNCAPRVPGGFMPLPTVIGAIIVGTIATALIQSSSVFTGIVLALAASGLVNFYTAFVLVLGSNIGSTLPAQLAGLTANRVGKQAALAHTLFNVFGVVVMTLLLYVPFGSDNQPIFLYFINAITPGDAFAAIPQNLARHIAMAHTFFNVTISLLLLPFVKQFAAVCSHLLPIRNKVQTRILEPGLLKTPAIAIKQSVSAIRLMVEKSWKMVDEAVNQHFLGGDLDPEKCRLLAEAEAEIDAMQNEVTAYLVQITRRPLTEPESELVPLLMHCTNDAERIADHTETILQLAERLSQAGKPLSEVAERELLKMWEVLDKQARNVIEGLNGDNLKNVKTALKSEIKINRLADKFEDEHINRLRKGHCSALSGVIYIEMLGELSKIGDRLSNIAERTPEIQKQYVEL